MCSYIKLGPVVLESLCSVDWNHFCSIGRRHHEDQSCEIILNLDQWCRRKQPCEIIFNLDQ